jgi:hypothetical protein
MNEYRPHVKVLPEDDANRQLALGFSRDLTAGARSFQVLRVAGGWLMVLKLFEEVHVREMDRNPYRFTVLLIDCDGDSDRLVRAKAAIPQRLTGRVFILGALTEPEKLRADIGKPYEAIGMALARDCHEGTDITWDHALLKHNAAEVERLRLHVRPILFP